MRLLRLLLLLLCSFAVAAQTYTISGTVVDSATHQPVPEAKISCIPSGQTVDKRKALVTSYGGRFVFASLPPGKYQLRASAQGYPEQMLNERDGYLTAVVTGPDKDSEHVVFALEREARIFGIIVDEAGEPVRDAEVALFRRGDFDGREQVVQSGFAQTNDLGAYKLHNVRPGTYYIAVAAHPWYANLTRGHTGPADLDVAYPVTFYGGATDENSATPIRIRAGSQFRADLALFPVHALHVTMPIPTPQTGHIFLQRVVFHRWQVASALTLNHTGSNAIASLAPGLYRVHVAQFDSPTASTERPRHNLNTTLQIDSDLQLDPTQLLSQGTKISGIVKVPAGMLPTENTPQRAALRFVSDDESQGNIADIQPDGRFNVVLPPGTYRLNMIGRRAMLVQDIVCSGSLKADGNTLTVSPGSGTIALSATNTFASINGTVLEGGKPASGAMVILIPERGVTKKELVRRDESDSDGTFALRLIPDGNYTLLALKNGWDLHWAEPGVLDPYLRSGTPIHILGTATKSITINAQ